LKNIDNRLDDVNQTLTSTQKNINQIKSIFGGLKNKFTNWGSQTPANNGKDSKDPVVQSKSDSKLPVSSSFNSMSTSKLPPQQKAEFTTITSSDREKEINKNLDEMSLGLGRLTNLAKEMSFELDKQNPLIDKLNNKVGQTHVKINAQNDQMKKILK
jgi:uncharacterized coiled-coil protein SlyX